jgi:hypothetical protein
MSNNIVPIRPTSLYRALKTLADDADLIVAREDELDELSPTTRSKMDALKDAGQIAKLIANAKNTATLSEYDEVLVARCNDALALLDPAENYEDNDRYDGNLRRGVIKVRLATLVGSFPGGAPSDADVYVRVMLEHVCSIDDLCLPALDEACYAVVATQKFLPATSELRKALSESQARWDRRLLAIYGLARTSRRVSAWIDAMQPKSK